MLLPSRLGCESSVYARENDALAHESKQCVCENDILGRESRAYGRENGVLAYERSGLVGAND